jgi:LacI family transcriptional regulator
LRLLFVEMRKRIAIVLSDVFLRRLTPALFPFVKNRQDYWILDIYRPVAELLSLINELDPVGIITEDLPGRTEHLLKLKRPMVIADTDKIYPGTISIDVDDGKVGQRAADFFVKAGFQHFAFLGNQTHYSNQRQQGFTRYLQHFGHFCHSHLDRENKGKTYMEYYRGQAPRLKEWLRGLPKPVGLFAAHDPLGRLVCEACGECFIPVPEEVAVLGANNDELICNLSYPPLSSVEIPWLKIGEMAGELLDRLITDGENKKTLHLVEPGEVIARESSDLSAVEDPVLRRALEYLRMHFHEDISIKTVCGILRINRRTFELKCREILGRSPKKELSRLRVEKAKSLLKQSEAKMEWIARQCGFSNAERFSVVFKQTEKQSPSSYRSKN